jgi:hypothetical protein
LDKLALQNNSSKKRRNVENTVTGVRQKGSTNDSIPGHDDDDDDDDDYDSGGDKIHSTFYKKRNISYAKFICHFLAKFLLLR